MEQESKNNLIENVMESMELVEEVESIEENTSITQVETDTTETTTEEVTETVSGGDIVTPGTTNIYEYTTYDYTEQLILMNENIDNLNYTMNCFFVLSVGLIASFIVYKFIHRLF